MDPPLTPGEKQNKASMEAMPQDTTKVNAHPPLTGDLKDTLLQMQWTNPFCKGISKRLLNRKAP